MKDDGSAKIIRCSPETATSSLGKWLETSSVLGAMLRDYEGRTLLTFRYAAQKVDFQLKEFLVVIAEMIVFEERLSMANPPTASGVTTLVISSSPSAGEIHMWPVFMKCVEDGDIRGLRHVTDKGSKGSLEHNLKYMMLASQVHLVSPQGSLQAQAHPRPTLCISSTCKDTKL